MSMQRSDCDRMGGKDNMNLVKIATAKQAGPVAYSSTSISVWLPSADISRTVDLPVWERYEAESTCADP